MVAATRRERADAPPAPPPPDEAEGALLGPVTPFDPAVMVETPAQCSSPPSGTAFSISREGRWLTARHVVEGCRRPALIIGGGRAVAADVRLAPRADVAAADHRGRPARPCRWRWRRPCAAASAPSIPAIPQGRAGRGDLAPAGPRDPAHLAGAAPRDEPVLAWAEVGRTDGLAGTLAGLSGRPGAGPPGPGDRRDHRREPRAGAASTPPRPTPWARCCAARCARDEPALGEPVTIDNYYRVADGLRRDLRVAQVVCLE